LKETEAASEEIRHLLNTNPNMDQEIRYHFPNIDGGEMWSRWDMQDTPPDILITNYSMLNITLMRQIESTIFDQTRQWLAADKTHKFLYHLKNPWLKSPCCSGLPAGEKTDILACSTRYVSPLEHAALCSKTLTCTASPMNRHANS